MARPAKADADTRRQWRAWKERQRRAQGIEGGPTHHAVYPHERPPPEDIAARLAEIPPDTRGVTATLFGDPLPGRRAIDRRTARPATSPLP